MRTAPQRRRSEIDVEEGGHCSFSHKFTIAHSDCVWKLFQKPQHHRTLLLEGMKCDCLTHNKTTMGLIVTAGARREQATSSGMDALLALPAQLPRNVFALPRRKIIRPRIFEKMSTVTNLIQAHDGSSKHLDARRTLLQDA